MSLLLEAIPAKAEGSPLFSASSSIFWKWGDPFFGVCGTAQQNVRTH